jgi:hypothetical protein
MREFHFIQEQHSPETARLTWDFISSYAPRYDKSFTGVMICFVVCFFCAEILRFFLARENKKREEQFGPPDDAHGLEDLTDKENKSFRYHL